MRVTIAFIFFISFIFSAAAQLIPPPKWSYAVSKKEIAVGDEVELIFKAKIQPDWYLYSTDFDPDLGPMVTVFTFESNDSYQLIGGIQPINPKKKYDDIWEGEYTYFTKNAEFRQKVKILKPGPVIKGSYDYQICSDVDGKCVPFDGEFRFDETYISVKKTTLPDNSDTIPAIAINPDSTDTPEDTVSEKTDIVQSGNGTDIGPSASSGRARIVNNFQNQKVNSSLWAFFILAFGAGLLALLTPCVYPMIPMTVTFFTGGQKSKSRVLFEALFFGISIIFIYVILGTLMAWINGPGFANWLSTGWLPNILFFLTFVLFGLAFLGMFEIRLPSSLVNKADKQADKGGLFGIFFMAFTLALVSFSCTGPIVGSILVESAGGIAVKPIIGMLGFSAAFAIPFVLFAVFPSRLSKIPKSGGWLNSVKVVLGFLELALALKFLSLADQAYHWRILDREIFLAAWIVIFGLIGLYLIGKIKLPHDSPLSHIGVPRMVLAIVVFSFTVYLIPGLFGAPLKALSGILPPRTTQDFDISAKIDEAVASAFPDQAGNLCEKPKHASFLKLPHNLKGYFDLNQALACAREQGKPVFVDFTGHGCVNCREMEEAVWSDPEVLRRLKNDFVVVALYVDDKTTLPEADWYTSTYDNKVKKTIGKQNANIQIEDLENNAQPYYVLLNYNGEVLLPPRAYDRSVKGFIDFLDQGLKAFNDKNKIVEEK